MRAKSRIGVALLAMALMKATPADSQTANVEQLVARLNGAAEKGDTDAVVRSLTAPSRVELSKLEASSAAFNEALSRWNRALDAKFGEAGLLLNPAESDWRARLARIGSVTMVDKEAQSDLTVALRLKIAVADAAQSAQHEPLLQRVLARLEDGEWKLDLTPMRNGDENAQRLAAVADTTKRLNGGDFETRIAAMVALDRALREEHKQP